MVGEIKDDVEVIGTGVVSGLARGYAEREGKDYQIKNIAPEVIVAAPIKVLAYSGFAKKAAHDLHNIGRGLLTGRWTEQARQWMRNRPRSAGVGGRVGALPYPSPAAVSAAMRARKAERVPGGAR